MFVKSVTFRVPEVVGVAHFSVCPQSIADKTRNPFHTIKSLNIKKIKRIYFNI